MPTLVSGATGNFTAAGTWLLVESGSLLDSEAANTALTTSYVASSNFTTGGVAPVIYGVVVKLASVAVSPTGTISVNLRNTTLGADVTGTDVVLNVSDLPACSTAQNEGGYILFKFATPVTLLTVTNYAVQAKTSSAAQVNLYSSATTNWSRFLVTTTTQAPVAGDIMHVMSEHTGAGTRNDFTVTMNETATTDYGPGTDGTTCLGVSQGGTLTWGVAASTNYYFKHSGNVVFYNGATLNLATVGSAMPPTSTAIIEWDPVADGGMGWDFRNGSIGGIYGAVKTVSAILSADAAANATSLTTDVSTAWADNDVLVVASTSRTAADTEKGQMNGAASGTTLTVDTFAGSGGGLLVAHKGSGSTKAEIINLTRNIVFRSATSTLPGYIRVRPTASVTIRYAEFYYLGDATAGKRGIEVETTTGTFDMQYSSLHDCEDFGYFSNTASGSPTFSHNVCYNLNTVAGNATDGMRIIATSGTPAFTFNICMRMFAGSSGSGFGFNFQDAALTLTDCTFVSCDTCVIGETNVTGSTWSTLTFHSTNVLNVIGAHSNYTFSACTWWRTTAAGSVINSSAFPGSITYLSCTWFGCTTSNLSYAASTTVILGACTFNSDASFTTANGILFIGSGSAGGGFCYIFGCSFGATTGHTAGDIVFDSNGQTLNYRVYAWNTVFGSATEFLGRAGGLGEYGGVWSHNHDNVAGAFKGYFRAGDVTNDATIRHTASGYALKLAPAQTRIKLRAGMAPTLYDGWRVKVDSGALVTITVWVLKNAAYNGNAARLHLLGGVIAGIASDVTQAYSKTQKTITAATNATPIVVTTSASHGYANGDVVLVEGVLGNTAANGRWVLANVTGTTFELVGSVGNGAWTSGGTVNVYQQLTVTGTPSEVGALEFCVECDGTAGAVYAHDAAKDGAAVDSFATWSRAMPLAALAAAAGGGGLLINPGLSGGLR